MSKTAVRKLVEGRYSTFTSGGIGDNRKSYPNAKNSPTPSTGRWTRLHDIEFVLHKIASIGSEPCTRRTGVIVIDAFEHLDVGTSKIYDLTDDIEEYFGLWSEPNFWTDPANTVNFPNDGDKNSYYQSRVYIPFTYDEN